MALKGIVVDPGHGGIDPGALSGKNYEKDLSLKISKRMYEKFKSLGVPVSITRTTDKTLSPSERVKKTLSYYGNSKDVIVISNHINAGGGEGAEVIYALRNNSKYADEILAYLKDAGQKIRKAFQKRSITNSKKDYYFMLRDTANTEAVIVEYGFIDNKNDLTKLNKNINSFADAVVNATIKYKNIKLTKTYIVKKGDTLFMGDNEYK